MDTDNCCVCGENSDILANEYTKCPFSHKICKICYLSILQMCYCKNSLGEVVYRCPLCRNDHIFSNRKMNSVLLVLVNSSVLCLRVHKSCENRNITKKCKFEKCGCRTNIVDVLTKNDLDSTIKDILKVANKYAISPPIVSSISPPISSPISYNQEQIAQDNDSSWSVIGKIIDQIYQSIFL